MEYQLRLEQALDHQHIERLIKAWLRGAAPVPGGPGPGIRTLGPNWPGGSARVDLFPGGTRAVTSPAHNVHSSHQMQTAGEVRLATGVHLRQLSQLGGKANHVFVVNGRELFYIQQAGLHGQWLRLDQHWHAPFVAGLGSGSVQPAATGLTDMSAWLRGSGLGYGGVGIPRPGGGGVRSIPSGPGLDVRSMSDWQKLLVSATAGSVQVGEQVARQVLEPLLSWEGILTVLGVGALLLIPVVGEVVLVGLIGLAIYDLLVRVTALFKEYYETAISASSWSELWSAGQLFARAVAAGLLDVLAVFGGDSALLSRLRALRALGPLTVRSWVGLVVEQAQLLWSRLRGGVKNFSDFIKERQPQPAATPAAPVKPSPVPPKPKGIPRRKRKNSTKTRKQRAKTNTDNMDQRKGGHSKGKHGTQVTPQQHEDRLRTGRDPQTGTIPTNRRGQPNRPPPKSGGFDTNEKQLEALGRADRELKEGLASGKYTVDANGRVEPPVDISMPKAGTSYSLDPPGDYSGGTVVTTPCNNARAIYRYNAVTGKFELVTLYPTP